MKRRQLLLTLLTENQGEYVSGETLAKRLQCSRAAVWKNIVALREEGYHIEAVTNHGYRLSLPGESFQQNVRARLTQANIVPAFDLHVLEQTVSTNLDAREAADRGAGEFSVFAALSRTGGVDAEERLSFRTTVTVFGLRSFSVRRLSFGSFRLSRCFSV